MHKSHRIFNHLRDNTYVEPMVDNKVPKYILDYIYGSKQVDYNVLYNLLVKDRMTANRTSTVFRDFLHLKLREYRF